MCPFFSSAFSLTSSALTSVTVVTGLFTEDRDGQAPVRPKCRAARVVSQTRKFDRGLTRLLHIELHWLDVRP